MTAKTIEEVQWVEAQATAHFGSGFGSFQINEVRQVNLQEPETRELVKAGLLVIVDEETRKLLPPPRSQTSGGGGCGCGGQ